LLAQSDRTRRARNEIDGGTVDHTNLAENVMPRPDENASDHEYERLNPGASADPPQPRPAATGGREKSGAELPGSQNSDLRGAKRDRSPRGMTT
jgi:hypothetical protein